MISKKHKAVFIHVPRTAGTSVEIAFGAKTFDHRLKKDYMKVLGEEMWGEYFKFTFVRNPWARFVSIYHNKKRNGRVKVPFKEWVRSLDKGLITSQYLWFYEDDKPIVDFIGRFENLEKDWQIICKKLGIEKKLPHANAISHRHYTTYYNKKTRKIAAKLCEHDIMLFGYKFGD